MEGTKVCPACAIEKPLSKYQLNPDGSLRKHVCKACYATKYRNKLKLEMLEAFGWKCECCEEAHPHFLTLDHKNNDGGVHRREANTNAVEVIYADARREGWPKDKYQLLCINCNWAKGKWGVCPHKAGKTIQEVIDELRGDVFYHGKQYQNHNLSGLVLGPAASAASPKHRGFNPETSRAGNAKQMIGRLSPEVLKALLEKYQK